MENGLVDDLSILTEMGSLEPLWPLHNATARYRKISHTPLFLFFAMQSMHAELAEEAAGDLLARKEQLGLSDVICCAAGDEDGTGPHFFPNVNFCME